MKQPPHVLAWKQALKHPKYQSRPDFSLEDACDRLLNQWLSSGLWQVKAFGRTWEGSLSNINYAGDVFFTITLLDPDDPARSMDIMAPFEQFIELSQEEGEA